MDGSAYCRTCAALSPGGEDDDDDGNNNIVNTNGMTDIFANEQINQLLSTLKAWQLDIMEDDGLPQCICETCELTLKRIDDFRIQALRAKEYLQMRLSTIVNCIATTEEDIGAEVMKMSKNNENDLHVGDIITTTNTYYNGSAVEIHNREAVLGGKIVTSPKTTTYEHDESTKHVNRKCFNNNSASVDNGDMGKVGANNMELDASAGIVNEDADLIESSRPPEFQIVLIEEHAEAQLQWIYEEDNEHSITVAEEKEDLLRNNELALIARTECYVGDNSKNNKLEGAVEDEAIQTNTKIENAIESQQTTDYETGENQSNKQAQGRVDVVIKENSQHETCVHDTQININTQANMEHISHGITQCKNELDYEEEDVEINRADLYLAEGCYNGGNHENIAGLILPLKQQQAYREINENCHGAQQKIKCGSSNRSNFHEVIPSLQEQHHHLKTFDSQKSSNEHMTQKHKTHKDKSLGMRTEITTTTTELTPQHIINEQNYQITHEEDIQIKELQALLAALNEQVTNKSETNSNYSSGDLDLDLQSIFMNDLTLQMINANLNIVEEDLQIDELETLLSLPVVDNAAEDEGKEIALELAEETTNKSNNERIEHNFLECYEKIFAATANESCKAEGEYQNQESLEYYGSNKTANESRDSWQTTTMVTITATEFENYEHEQLEDLIPSQIITSNEEQELIEKYVDDDSGLSLVFEDKLIHEPLNNNESDYCTTEDYLTIDNTSFSNSVNSNFTETTTTATTTPIRDNNKSPKPSPTTTCPRARHRHRLNSTAKPTHNKSKTKITNILRCRFCVCKISEQPIFATTQLLEQHIALEHDDKERPYNCPQCAARYRTRSGCVAHVNAIHLKKFDNCKLCNKIVAGGTGQMRMHMERNHTRGNYTCEICHLELKNVTLYNFKYHKRWHDENKLWRCELCEKAFVTRTHLVAHKVTHTRQGEFLCTRCGKSTRSKWELRQHLYAMHDEGDAPLKCNYCDEKFTQHIQKRVHLERYHPNEEQTKRTTVPCTKCDKQFSTEINLQRHVKKHHNEGSFDILMKKVAASASTPQYEGFMCAHCPRKYRSKYALIKHLHVHTKMPDKPYSCPDCFMHFKHFSELDRHDLQHHADVRPYNCEECAKRFSTRTALKIHQRVHEVKGRNFRCPQCDQRFKFEKSLNLHLISHKTMRHSCDICNKSYIRLTQLKTHKNRYHQIQSDSEEE